MASQLIYTEGCPHPRWRVEAALEHNTGPVHFFATCLVCGRSGDDAGTEEEAVAALRRE